MMLPVLQIAAVIAIALYLLRWRKSVQRRNSQTWETLMARLRSEWSARELSDHFLWQEGLSATPEDAWQRMEGPKGLWVMYQNARVMLEMADYAAKHCEGVDRLLDRNTAQRRDADSRLRADGPGAICISHRPAKEFA